MAGIGAHLSFREPGEMSSHKRILPQELLATTAESRFMTNRQVVN
jgi:hypothetical protein